MPRKYSKQDWLDKICKKFSLDVDSLWYKEFQKIIDSLSCEEISKYRRLFESFVDSGIPTDLFKRFNLYIKIPGKVTQEKCILRYGESDGLKRWKSYCYKQRISNSFDYKREKYGMNELEFDAYNKSRSITKENCILRYGESDGLKRWKSYCDKQRVNGCKLEYFIEKYGNVEGTLYYKELNKKKSPNLYNFQRKYGNDVGIQKFEDYINKSKVGYSSTISQIFFDNLYDILIKCDYVDSDKIYYSSKNFEFGSINEIGKFYKYDFVDTKNKIVIEFNGDFWHGNPKLYKSSDIIKKSNFCMKVEDIWTRDKLKNEHMENLGYKVFVVWEFDYRLNKDGTVEDIINAAYRK